MWTIPWEHVRRGSVQVLYFNGKHSLPLSSLFLIGRVCRKFITYIGQGNLHVFLEIFLALDFTAILALQADGGLAIPSLFTRHKDMHRSLKPWAASLLSSLLLFPSELVLVALLVSSDHRPISLHSLWPQRMIVVKGPYPGRQVQ